MNARTTLYLSCKQLFISKLCLAHLVATAVFLILVPGCTVGPHYHAPAPPTVGTYTPDPQPTTTVPSTGPAGAAQHLNSAMDIPAQWWTLFQSPELDRLVREALANSPTLAQATARLKQAQEESNARTGATKYPTVNANISAQREQVDLATFGVPFPSPPPVRSAQRIGGSLLCARSFRQRTAASSKA